MTEIIPNGTEVLIFRCAKNCNNGVDYEKRKIHFETNFVKGEIISSKESDNLSYHGSPWHEQIYTIHGQDGKQYTATYGSAYIGENFIRTIDDYMKHIRALIKKNIDQIDDLEDENKILYNVLNSLIHMEQNSKINELDEENNNVNDSDDSNSILKKTRNPDMKNGKFIF